MQPHGKATTDNAIEPAIDRACMAEMWEDVGATVFLRMAELFEPERQTRLAQLHIALRANDRKTLAIEAHSLKGAAAYICATGLREAAWRLEREAPSAEPDQLARLVAVVAVQADEAHAELAYAIAEKISGD